MRMKKRLSLLVMAALLLTLLVPAGAFAAENSPSYEATKQLAAQKADLLTKNYGTYSLQYALIDQGKIVVSGQSGINHVSDNTPLTADSMYGIGSTSKMFTTVAVMKLVDEGKIDLDQSLTTYIPDFKMKDERYKKITPRMLLNHSSGLSGSTFVSGFLFDDNDTSGYDNLLKRLEVQRLKADPGAFSVYCNDGFTLAEILVERVSGLDFTDFIHKFITEPLGMKNTKTPQDDVNTAQLAGVYSPAYQGELPRDTVNFIGAGGIYSTAEDLARFSQIFTGNASGLLSEKSVAATAKPEYKNGLWPKEADSSIAYGLGWDSVNLFPFNDYGIQALTKGGDTLLSHASLVVLPEQKLSVAVLSSGGSGSLDQIMANQILLSAMQEKGIIKELKPAKSFGVPVKVNMPAEISTNAGIYGTAGQLIKLDISKDGELSLSSLAIPEAPVQKFTYTADGSFVSEDGSTKLNLVTEDNGRTYLWVRAYSAIPGLGQMAMSEYQAEKLEPNELSKDVAKAWEAREGKTYFLVSEKYTSQAYFMQPPIAYIATLKDMPGYLMANKITGANEALNLLNIPTLMGRDTSDLIFFTDDGVEYLEAAGSLFVSQDNVTPLYIGKKSKTKIQENGQARWYTIPEKSVGKTLSVNMPKAGSFAVYDANGTCVNFTVVSGVNEVVLPANGFIAFIGDPGSQFEISLK
ncbi:serine hydrolase domain-containing protein [Paenibacillus motobuensis]|uniref:Serine hydrolase domain-containing protein n=2 Tax=Paenibacillus motobuensis TaxID=295324 RepID=A0ABN0YRF6_9BACL